MRLRLALLLAAGVLLAVPVAASAHPMQINSFGAFGTGAAATFTTPPPTFPGPTFIFIVAPLLTRHRRQRLRGRQGVRGPRTDTQVSDVH